ncbi:MAG: alpha/beta hydrolase [Spirochaetaceae bacterium]|nr:alpha/beta hydrolase [Spirochaetaceae bacterium]
MSRVSLLYRIVEFAAARIGYKKIFRYNAEELRGFLNKIKDKRNAGPPEYIRKKYNLTVETICGKPCYIIAPKEKPASGRAILFIHGGGYVMEAHPVHWRAASLLVDRLVCPVWFPVYPLFPCYTIPDANAVITEVYAAMLGRYRPQDINVLGDSAGAALALTLCHHINKQGNALPMPGKLVLVSPAMIVEDDQTILSEMRRLEPVDVMLATPFFDSMRTLFKLDANRENYYNSMFYGDFSGFPSMHIFSGTFECVHPQVAAFAGRLNDEGIKAAWYPGERMMHIWPYIPFAPECKQALEKIFEIIRK